jgi:dUTPase
MLCTMLFAHVDGENEERINPRRATSGSAGIDIFLPQSTVVESHETKQIDHRLTLRFPKHVYGQIYLRSSTTKTTLQVLGGVLGNLLLLSCRAA